jgi:hypothetical protein
MGPLYGEKGYPSLKVSLFCDKVPLTNPKFVKERKTLEVSIQHRKRVQELSTKLATYLK